MPVFDVFAALALAAPTVALKASSTTDLTVFSLFVIAFLVIAVYMLIRGALALERPYDRAHGHGGWFWYDDDDDQSHHGGNGNGSS